jgi:hypothetical protein|tara:strand:+ start:563 stop:1039 length:477 start_codon:yes stop_codon:yes gene_type:complete
MGFIVFPDYVENFYLSSLGNEWVTQEVFEEEFDEKYPNQMVLFDQEKTTKFMIYFTTDIKNQQPKDWEQIMMVVGETKNSKKYGKYIKINTLYRYGFAVGKVMNLQDLLKEIEQYFPEGATHIDLANENNIYYTYVGFASSFPDLMSEVKFALKGVKN